MIRAHELIIVSRINYFEPSAALALILLCRADNTWGKLVIEIVEMHDIRLKITQHGKHFFTRVRRVYGFERIAELCQRRRRMEIHILSINAQSVAHDIALMAHPEILHLIAEGFKLLSYFENICFRAALRKKEFIDYQNLQAVHP